MADQPDVGQVITIRAEGTLPGELLAVKALEFRMKILEWMTPEQRGRALDRLDDIEEFFHDLGSPLRNLAGRLKDVGK